MGISVKMDLDPAITAAPSSPAPTSATSPHPCPDTTNLAGGRRAGANLYDRIPQVALGPRPRRCSSPPCALLGPRLAGRLRPCGDARRASTFRASPPEPAALPAAPLLVLALALLRWPPFVYHFPWRARRRASSPSSSRPGGCSPSPGRRRRPRGPRAAQGRLGRALSPPASRLDHRRGRRSTSCPDPRRHGGACSAPSG